ncbi:MAG: DUF6264 family protein [Microbacteriaceae bacterium]
MSDPSQPTPPEVPPVPRYGEYAPAGYVPPTQPQSPAPVPQGAYPQYGYPMHPAPGVRRRKTWDLVLTIVLLVMGFFGMLIGLLYAGIISDPALMDQIFQQQNLGDFDGTVGAAPVVIIASHVILYLAVLGGSIPLLISKRVTFWLPLAAGVIAAIIFWAALGGVFLSDPDFISTYS